MTKIKKTFRLILLGLLAAAVIVSSLAVVPQSASAAAPDAANTAAPRFTARIIGNKLTIDGSGFPARRGFFVKARRNANFSWIRLGAIQADRSGRIHGTFNLPDELRKGYTLRVCLKDLKNSNAYCVYARRVG